MDRFLEFATNHPLLVGGFFAVLLLLIWTEVRRRLGGVAELSPAEAVNWINDDDAVVIDISPVADFNKGHIVDARNIQPSRLAKPDAEIVCGKGLDRYPRRRGPGGVGNESPVTHHETPRRRDAARG
mgnify:CR=1 FL=1